MAIKVVALQKCYLENRMRYPGETFFAPDNTVKASPKVLIPYDEWEKQQKVEKRKEKAAEPLTGDELLEAERAATAKLRDERAPAMEGIHTPPDLVEHPGGETPGSS